MAFASYGVQQSEKSTNKTVDFDKLNEYVVETAQLQERETLVGVVSVIADLGLQAQEDAKVVFTGTEEDERKAIAEYPETYFEDGEDESGNPARLKRWPQKAMQCVAVAVDFPDILVDKGQFFGESNPLPLRLWLGGQFYVEGSGMIVQRMTGLKVNKKLGNWSLDQKNLFHKMAVAAKLVKPNEAFLPQRIDELLGRSFQFEAQVFFKESKGKKYYTEYVKFVSGLGRGQSELETPVKPVMLQFNAQNEEEAVKGLRAHVVNTMKRAENYEGSIIKAQIESVRGVKPETQQASTTKVVSDQDGYEVVEKAKAKAKPKKAEVVDDLDELPF